MAGILVVVLSVPGFAKDNVSIPPELATGDLQLVFDKDVDTKKLQALVEETRAKSNALRAQALAGRTTQDVAKVKSPDNWRAALQQKKWLPEANAYIRKYVPEILKGPHSTLDSSTTWYCYFGPGGKFPDRLEPETIAFLKETMWHWAQYWLDPEGSSEGLKGSFQQNMAKNMGGKPFELLPLDWSRPWSNENIEIRYKLPLYLVLDALRKDPAYATRRMGDKTVEEWFAIFKPHIIDFLRDRVMAGLWEEPGSTYTEVTYVELVRLYNLAPDPEIRQMAKMVLDLVFIEDATLCVNNIRGGGRSRAYGALRGKHDGIKELVYGESAVDGRFSIDYEFSDYQAPAIAVVLHRAKGAVKPYAIVNRVPGEMTRKDILEAQNNRDSRLINYVYRTPGYSLGCSLMNPNLTYKPNSNQERMSSLLFQSGQYIYVMAKNLPTTQNSGRSGKAYWSIQHENMMMLQQFVDSGHVEAVALFFSGGLNIVEREGWIFASAESGYAAVRYIDPSAGAADASYKWDADFKPRGAMPKDLRRMVPTGTFLPILIHAGDPDWDGSFEQFQKTVLAGKITIDPAKSRIEYRPKEGAAITWCYNQKAKPLELALVNGQPPNLSPALLFDGPFMKAKFGDPKIYVGAGPFRAVYDFDKATISESAIQ